MKTISNTGNNRYKIITYFLVVLILVLSSFSCNLKNSELEPTVKNYQNNYEELILLTDSYFRAFYDKNKSYTSECITIDTILDAKGNLLTSYYDNDALVYADFITFGDLSTTYRKYYFINTEIVYITKCTSDSNNDIGGNYKEFYIINGQLQALSHLNKDIESSVDADEKEIFDIITDKMDLHTKKFVEFECTSIPNGLYSTYNEAKHNFFIKNFINNKVKNSKVLIQIDDLKLNDDFFSYNCIALLRDNQLMKFALLDSNNKCRVRYDYYVVDDDIGYVIVTNSEYSSESKYMEECVKTHYSEYFIIDGKVMKYDSNKQDLIESSDDTDVLASFNVAKDIIGIKYL
ncbi:MAG: hypothetical protein NC177_14750 [Ruminococcus flavefaciens]|nr:hypothetical protein [Ruminococcus flavefaciens]